jgi:RNA polymerase sigma-70 factor (ECF subfamily)
LQEVALVVTQQWRDFQTGTNFPAWARQIARNKLIARKRDGRRPEFMFSPEALANLERAADRRSTSQNQLDDLRDCISKLGQKAAALVTMRYGNGYDCERIANEQRTTAANVYMMLSRIRARLADCIRAKQKEKH